MVYELFTRSMELPSAKRQEFLHSQCSDERILAQVLALISADNDEFTLSSSVERDSNLFYYQSAVNVGDVVSVYQLESCLGSGGMGTVYKAKRIDGNFEQTVAIKVISPQLYQFLDTSRLNSEANFMAKLNHNSICTVHDAGITNSGVHYIVMEYIEGSEISTFFADLTITFNEKLAVFCDLCDAVNYAHQEQIVHGDLKPANILFSTNKQLKILDFGISHVINDQNNLLNPEQQVHFNAMTTDYASPELMNGEKPSLYSDVYALGKILSNLVILCKVESRHYFPELFSILNKATATLTTERYASVSEMKNDISAFLSGYVVSTYQANHLYKIKKFVFNRHPISVVTSLIFVFTFSILIANLIAQHQALKKEKYQTDLMLEKFSLVLDLDLDAKSDVEMTLANNYESKDEDDKAEILYKKIVSRFGALNDKDKAFSAGSRLIKLLIKTKRFELIKTELDELKAKLQFFPNSNLAVSAHQAMFYHFFINSTYHRSKNNNDVTFKFHSDLMQGIKDKYWQELTNQQKAELTFSMDIKYPNQVVSQINASEYYPEFENMIENESLYDIASDKVIRFRNDIYKLINKKNNSSEKLLPQADKIADFLESAPIFWTSTHKRNFSYEEMNQAVFSNGISKFKENSGVYKVQSNTLRMDFGEGPESDNYIYVSPQIALSVPLADGDLTVLAHKDFLNDKNNELWTSNELINREWYHIYDGALEQKNVVQPSMVKITFNNSAASLIKGKKTINSHWSISNDLLILKMPDDETLIELVKVVSDEDIIIVKTNGSKLPSLLINNKTQAEFIMQSWQELL